MFLLYPVCDGAGFSWSMEMEKGMEVNAWMRHMWRRLALHYMAWKSGLEYLSELKDVWYGMVSDVV